MRAQVPDTVRTAQTATMEVQFKRVFEQRQARLEHEQNELRAQLAQTTDRLAQTADSHNASDGILKQQLYVQQQETTYAWHKLEHTERLAQEEVIATQLAANRVVQATFDSTTAALEHSRRRIDQTQHNAATAIDYSKSAEAEALELTRRLADHEMHEQRVDLTEKAEHELSAIS